MGWRPISTAPTNGTMVDLWENTPVGGFRRTDALFRDGRWIVWDSDYANGFEEIVCPTHWMPLPKPPVK